MTLKGFDFSLTELGVQETYHEGGANREKRYLLFCDGISANADAEDGSTGQAAAHLVRESLKEYFELIHQGELDEESLRKAFQHANERLLQLFDLSAAPVAVSALVLACTSKEQKEEILIGGLGDCRVLAIHSDTAETVFYDPEAAEVCLGLSASDRLHKLRNCLGSGEHFKMHFYRSTQDNFQRYMILSYGAQQIASLQEILQMGLRPHDPSSGVTLKLRSCEKSVHAVKICSATFEMAEDPLLVMAGVSKQQVHFSLPKTRGTKERLVALALSVVACGVISFIALTLNHEEKESDVALLETHHLDSLAGGSEEPPESISLILQERFQLQNNRILELGRQVKEYRRLLDEKTREVAQQKEQMRSANGTAQASAAEAHQVAPLIGTKMQARADINSVRESEQNRLAGIAAAREIQLEQLAAVTKTSEQFQTALSEREEKIAQQEAIIAELDSRNKELAAAIEREEQEGNEEALAQLQAALSEREEQIAQQEAIIAELDSRNKELAAIKQEQQESNEAALVQLQATLGEREDQFAQQEAIIAELDSRNKELAAIKQEQQESNEAALAQLQAALSEREDQIGKQEAIIAELYSRSHEQAAAIEREQREINEEALAQLQAALREREEKIGHQEALIAELDSRNHELAAAIEKEKQELGKAQESERASQENLKQAVSQYTLKDEETHQKIAQLELDRSLLLEKVKLAEVGQVKLIQQEETAQEEKKHLEEQLEKSIADRNTLTERIAVLTGELQSQNEQIAALNNSLTENKVTQETVIQMEERLANASQRYETLSKNYDARSQELTDATEKLADLEFKLSNYENIKAEVRESRLLTQDLGERLEKCRTEIEDLTAIAANEKHQNELLNRKIETLSISLNEEGKSKTELIEKYEKASEDLKCARVAYQDLQKQSGQSIEELKSIHEEKLKEINDSLAAAQDRATSLELILQEKENKLAAAKNDLESLQNEHQANTKQLAQLESSYTTRIQDLTARLQQNENQLQQLENQSDTSKKSLEAMQIAYEKTKEDLQQAMAKLRSAETLYSQEQKNSMAASSVYQERLASLKNEHDKRAKTLESDLSLLQKQQTEFEAQLIKAQEERSAAVAAMKKSKDEREQALERINKLDYVAEENSALKKEIAALEKRIDNRNMATNASLGQQIKDLNGWLEAEKRKTFQLEQDVQKANEELANAVKKTEEQQRQVVASERAKVEQLEKQLADALNAQSDTQKIVKVQKQLQEELAALKNRCEAETARNKELQKNLDMAKARLEETSGDSYLNELNSKIEQLEASVQKEKSNRQKLENSLNETQVILSQKEEKLGELAAALKDLQTEKSRTVQLNEELSQLRSSAEEKTRVLQLSEALKKRYEDLQLSFNREQEKSQHLEEQLKLSLVETREKETQLTSTQKKQQMISDEFVKIRKDYDEKINKLKDALQSLTEANQAMTARMETSQKEINNQKKILQEAQSARELLAARTKQLEEDNQKLLDQKSALMEKVVASEQYQTLYENEKALRQKKDEHIQTFNSALQEQKEKLATLQSSRTEKTPSVQSATRSRTVQSRSTPEDVGATTRIHLVSRGETLSSISQRYYGSAMRWQEILEANNKAIDDPNRLKVGTALVIP